MPTYEYACDHCGHRFEEFQSITARPLADCPQCGRRRLRRLIGPGAGLIFKGSGFYQTDYRSESYRKAAAADGHAAGVSTGDGGAPEARPAGSTPAGTGSADTASGSSSPGTRRSAAGGDGAGATRSARKGRKGPPG